MAFTHVLRFNNRHSVYIRISPPKWRINPRSDVMSSFPIDQKIYTAKDSSNKRKCLSCSSIAHRSVHQTKRLTGSQPQDPARDTSSARISISGPSMILLLWINRSSMWAAVGLFPLPAATEITMSIIIVDQMFTPPPAPAPFPLVKRTGSPQGF